jgi:hypothetical protein
MELEVRDALVSLVSDKFPEFIQITLDEGAAPVRVHGGLLQASDTFLELLSALRAHDIDKALAINHRLRS